MENKLSKAELLSGVRFVQTTELDSQVSPKTDFGAATKINEESGQSGSLDGIAIARAEMARRRRGLGTLTRGQEVAIENLLLSTASRISELVGKVLDANTVKAYRSSLLVLDTMPKPSETNRLKT